MNVLVRGGPDLVGAVVTKALSKESGLCVLSADVILRNSGNPETKR